MNARRNYINSCESRSGRGARGEDLLGCGGAAFGEEWERPTQSAIGIRRVNAISLPRKSYSLGSSPIDRIIKSIHSSRERARATSSPCPHATMPSMRKSRRQFLAVSSLGLLGAAKGLTSLKRAVQADDDRDVRHSAQFSIDVIQATLSR